MRYCWNWSISRYHQVDLHQEIKLCNAKPLQKNCSEISYIKQERRSDTYFIADSLSANFFSKSYPHFLTWSSLFQFIIQSKTKSSTCYGSRITTELKWRSEMDCVMIYNEKKERKKRRRSTKANSPEDSQRIIQKRSFCRQWCNNSSGLEVIDACNFISSLLYYFEHHRKRIILRSGNTKRQPLSVRSSTEPVLRL